MSRENRMNVLIELAQNGVDAAAGSLQSISQQHEQALHQMHTLQEYRTDYMQRLQETAGSGLSVSNYHNFRQFIATLDEAITQQNKVVGQLGDRLARGREAWHTEKRRLASYETLQSRYAEQRALTQNRSEQRANDDLSARQFRQSGRLA